MRLLYITTSFPDGRDNADGHFVLAEVAEAINAGAQVDVVVPTCEPPRDVEALTRALGARAKGHFSLREARGYGLFGWPGALSRLRRAGLRSLTLPVTLLQMRKAVTETPYDRIIAHWLIPSAFPLALGTGKLPLEVVVHGSDARLLMSLPPLGRFVIRRLLARNAQFRFVSDSLRRSLIAATVPSLAAHSSVRPAAISVPQLPCRTELRRQLGLSEHAFIAVVVSRLVAGKRVSIALEQAQAPKNTAWYVVGDGPALGALKRAHPNATYLGQLPRREALRWIGAANTLVNASREEGAPTTIREARALGTEVWTCDCGDVSAWAEKDPGIRLFSALN